MQKTTAQQLQNSKGFFISLLLLWTASLCWLGWQGKSNGFLLMRPKGNEATDLFFQYATHIGDGLFAIALVILLLLFKRFGFAFVTFFGYAVSGILAQLLKHSVQSPRPSPFFRSIGIEIHSAGGVELLQSSTSFPSGHTATAFALATAVVLMSSWWQRRWWLAFVLAVFIGYSRIYLGQHFLLDVLAGSVLGTVSSIGGYAILKKWNPAFLLRGRGGN